MDEQEVRQAIVERIKAALELLETGNPLLAQYSLEKATEWLSQFREQLKQPPGPDDKHDRRKVT